MFQRFKTEQRALSMIQLSPSLFKPIENIAHIALSCSTLTNPNLPTRAHPVVRVENYRAQWRDPRRAVQKIEVADGIPILSTVLQQDSKLDDCISAET